MRSEKRVGAGALVIEGMYALACAALVFVMATAMAPVAGAQAKSKAAAAKPACDRACLEGIASKYLDAMVAHDASKAPLATDVKYSQDNVPLKIGQALWATATKRGKYIHYFADPEQGDVGFIAIVYEEDVPGIMIARLKVVDGKITEAEQFMAHDPHGAALYEKMGAPEPLWLQPVPEDQRETRAALDQAAWMYYEGLALNDGEGVYSFTADCRRTEDAVYTTNQPKPTNYGHADNDVGDFTTMNCTDQYKLGFLGFTTGCRHRRFLVTDVERGAVLANAYLDFDGTVTNVKLTDGRNWKVPPYFMTPRTNQSNEAYRIEKGSIRLIEMTMYEIPFNMEPAFHTGEGTQP